MTDLAKRVLELEAAIRCVIETDDYFQRAEIYRDDGVHSKHDTCVHGLPAYNGCEACICDFLSKAIAPDTEAVE